MEITKRELLFSIVIVILSITIGLFVYSGLAENRREEAELYTKALKIEELEDFNYEEAKRIREYELWLLEQGKTDQKNYKLLGSIRLLLTCEKVKINKYSDKLDSNKKIRKKEQKVYSL